MQIYTPTRVFYTLLLDNVCCFFPLFTTLVVDILSNILQAAFLPSKRTFKELQVKHQRITFEIRGSGCKEEYSLYFRQESDLERLSICFFPASFQSTFRVIY